MNLLDKSSFWFVEAHLSHLDGHLSAVEGDWYGAVSAWRRSTILWKANGYPYQKDVDLYTLAFALAEVGQFEAAQGQ